MAQPSYKTQAIVLRKTKLGETDLILTFLAADGSQLRAVAKGARKPLSSFAVRLELYSVVEILCAEGKKLDIVKEVRLLEHNERVRGDIEYSAGAAPMVELLDKVTHAGLIDGHLFDMTRVALNILEQAQPQRIPALCAAHLLKTLAFVGLRPSLAACVSCQLPFELNGSDEYIRLSLQEGGVLCDDCAVGFETILTNRVILSWSHYLLSSPFVTISKADIDLRTAFEVLHFCQAWIREHINAELKSLNFIFTCGLYE